MPPSPPKHITRKQAITNIIDSVAQEQSALAKILDAESEKLEKFIHSYCICPNDLLKANKSVDRLVNSVSRLELILQAKLSLFDDCVCDSCERAGITEAETSEEES